MPSMVIRPAAMSMDSGRTTCRPIGFGRAGERSAKTPFGSVATTGIMMKVEAVSWPAATSTGGSALNRRAKMTAKA